MRRLGRQVEQVADRQAPTRCTDAHYDLSGYTDDEIETLVVLAEKAERAQQVGVPVAWTLEEAAALERLTAKHIRHTGTLT